MKFTLIFLFFLVGNSPAFSSLKFLKASPLCLKEMSGGSNKWKNLRLQSPVARKYLLHTQQEACFILNLKEQFSQGKPSFCQGQESSTDCFSRIQKEMIKSAPLTATGVVFFISVNALEIFKSKKKNKDLAKTKEEKRALIYSSAITLIETTLISIEHMNNRKTFSKMFPLKKKMNLSDIPDHILAVALKDDHQSLDQFEKKFPFVNTPAFEFTVLELIDDLLALDMISKGLKKNISLNRTLLTGIKKDAQKLKDPQQTKNFHMMEQRLNLTLEKLLQFDKKNSIILKSYKKYFLMSQAKN